MEVATGTRVRLNSGRGEDAVPTAHPELHGVGKRWRDAPAPRRVRSAGAVLAKDRYHFRALAPFGPGERRGPRFIVGMVRRDSARQ